MLLLTHGDVKMKGARSTFCLNFFGCAAFDITQSEEYEGTDADLIILVQLRSRVPALAQEVCPKVKVPVLVAGNPKEQIAALQAAGVQGFIHVLSDLVETLTEWQNKLGSEERAMKPDFTKIDYKIRPQTTAAAASGKRRGTG